jgi:hypothetical protein
MVYLLAIKHGRPVSGASIVGLCWPKSNPVRNKIGLPLFLGAPDKSANEPEVRWPHIPDQAV